MKTVCVYCASSSKAAPIYLKSATDLGRSLTENNLDVVYGGGSTGLMGALADSVLENKGTITGVLPDFMEELEWGHKKVNMINVGDMHERKRIMLEMADAVVALAGGCGTFEEILEAITWRRLGLFKGPAIIVNTNNYYDPIIAQLNRAVDENFMNDEHPKLWVVVSSTEELMAALQEPTENENSLANAAVTQ
jgi:uncharacterized protein (TIGR00730 family)